MSFRKRTIPISYSPSSVLDVVDGVDGRTVVTTSIETYRQIHPIPAEEFTLTEELQSGVPLKEIPCGSMLNPSDSLDVHINEQDILDSLTKQSK